MYSIEAINVVKYYDGTKVLDNVSLKVYEGEVYGLLGPNGAGKSTLIEIILGLRSMDSGEIRVFGESITSRKFNKRVIGYVPQEHLLYENLTGLDNIKYFAGLYGVGSAEFKKQLNTLKEFFGLDEELLKKDVSKMSGGQKRRVALATSLINNPKLVLMDEPTTGLDPKVRREFWHLITELNNMGITILLTTHYMEEADELCDRVSIIDRGRIVASGTPQELKKKYGGGESLIIKMRSKFIEKAKRILESYTPEIISEDSIRIQGLTEKDIPEVRERLERSDVWVDGFEIRRPSLDDVFINLTGRRLERE